MKLGTWGNRVVFGISIVLLMLASTASADVAAAQKAIDDAKSNIANQDWNTADTNLKLAEAQLDGVSDADKKPVQDQIDALTKQLADAQASGAKAAIQKQAQSIIDEAKQYTTEHPDPNGVLDDAKQLDDFLSKDDTRAALTPDEIANYQKQMAVYKTVALQKKSAQDITNVKNEFQRVQTGFDAKMADIKANNTGAAHDQAIETLGTDLETLGKHLNGLPQDNADVKKMQTSYAQMNSTYTAAAASGQAAATLQSLKDNWALETEYKGWESETTPPSFEQFSKQVSQEMDAFNMPKTKNLIERSEFFLSNRDNDNDYKAVANTPDVKAFIDSIKKMHDDAYAKILKAASGLVDQAEKAQITARNRDSFDRLKGDITQALGDKSPDGPALTARIDKITTGFEQATAGAAQAKVDAYNQLKAQADKDWPDMKAKFNPVENFDPNNYKDFKGKQIRLVTDNLMGYRFNPGAFPFATTKNNLPIAARYSARVKAAIDDIEKKIPHDIGDNDSDGKWEVIAVVDGTTGRLSQRKQYTADVKTTDGDKIGTLSGEDAVDVDAPIVTIIGAHCGPLAVADLGGSSDSSASAAGVASGGGVIGSAAPTAGSSAAAWMRRILFLIIGLVAAAAALLKANFAPLATVPQVGQVQTRIGGTNLAYIGFVCAIWGLISLLLGYIIYGLLVNLAIIAAGLYAGLDWLVAKGMIKQDLAEKIRPLGVPIGLACAVLVILELIVQGRLYIL